MPPRLPVRCVLLTSVFLSAAALCDVAPGMLSRANAAPEDGTPSGASAAKSGTVGARHRASRLSGRAAHPAAARAGTHGAVRAPGGRAGARSSSAIPTASKNNPPGPVQAQNPEQVLVTVDPVALHAGGGMIRPQDVPQSISTVGADYIARQAPSATAYDLVAILPGANVSGSDPFGFSPQTNISVRGLNNDAIGYTLEGMPLNDVAYYTGYPSQFADSENYESVSLAQGAADIESPVLNAAGGLMKLRFRTPAEKAGGMVNMSYGSYDTNREFIRVDSGEIGKTGLRGFVSYSHGATDNWRGAGRDQRQHVDFKLLKTWGNQNSAALLGSWNQAIDSYYPQATKESWAQDGIGGQNNLTRHYHPDDAAQGTDYWRLYRQAERTLYLAAPVDLHLAHGLTWRTTPYTQGAYGNVPGGEVLPVSNAFGVGALSAAGYQPSAESESGAVMRADYTQRSYRSGFTTALEWKHGPNTLTAGYWYDYADDTQSQTFTPVSADGTAHNIWGGNSTTSLKLADGSLYRTVNNHTISQTNALFVTDTLSLLHDRLLLSAGFKEVMFTRNGTNAIAGTPYHANTNTAVPLPRLSVRYQITPHHQVFFNTTTNFRTPAETALYSALDPQLGTLTTQGSTSVKNEYSIAEELGYRYADNIVVGSLTLFNYNFTNRQIETLGVINGSYVSSTMNAGGQTSRGVDVELGLRPWHHISPYVSGEYLHATVDNDLMSGGDLLPTRGKRAVRSPTLQAAAGLTYDDGHAFGVFTVKYTGHQYATFMNDERMPDYVTANMAVGYRFDDVSVLHRPELRMNFINITNQHYLSGVADPTLNAKDTQGRYGTTIAGESPDYYIGGGFAAMFTASTGF